MLETTMKEKELIEALMRRSISCPIKDDADIDFEKECKGYREDGCFECIYNHTDELS